MRGAAERVAGRNRAGEAGSRCGAMRLTAVLLGALCLAAGCASGAASPPAPRSDVVVTVRPRLTGHVLEPNFLGLSLEAFSLSRDQFAHTNLAGYLKTLDSAGLLRIGGNSGDETFWTSRHERPSWWSQGTVTPASLKALEHAISGTRWRVILAVDLKHPDPARAADEAWHTRRILGSALAGIEIGNEPDAYYPAESGYFPEFERYVRAIRAAVPGVALAGPDSERDDLRWAAAFARQEAPHHDIAMFTVHHYPLSVCNGQHPTIAELLSGRSTRQAGTVADAAVAAADRDRALPVIDETNSIVCWGAAGVSNVYASALWLLDYALVLAQHGVAAADFHGKISGCNPYSPMCPTGGGSRLRARPEFYGLLAVRQMGAGRFLSVTSSRPASVRSFAVENGPGRLTIALIDVGRAVTVKVELPSTRYRRGRETALTTTSPRGLSATSGSSLGGERVRPDGSFPGPIYRPLLVATGRAFIRIPTDSAVIVSVD